MTRSTPDGQTVTVGRAEEGRNPTPGDHVGRYIVLGELGRGGMGAVFRAYDPKLEREVALKTLRLAGPVAAARFTREAHVMAQLSHPNVVPVFDVGQDGAELFIAMELVVGTTVSRWLAKSVRDWREILDVFIKAGHGLAAAHEAGIIHRDFKPANVMLSDDGRVRVLDFGLARGGGDDSLREGRKRNDSGKPESAGWESEGGTERLTDHGSVMGTPPYMAPEHLRGEELDERADVFSFCVSLYEGLYGRRPFPRTDRHDPETGLAGALRPTPSDRRVPAWLRAIVLKGLAADSAARWDSMGPLLAALADDPGRRRRLWALGAVGAAALAAAVAGVQMNRAAAVARCDEAGREIAGHWSSERAPKLSNAFSGTAVEYASSSWSKTQDHLDRYAKAWAEARTQVCTEFEIEGTRAAESAALAAECLEDLRLQVGALIDQLEAPDEEIVRWAPRASAALTRPASCLDNTMLGHRPRLPTDPVQRAEVAAIRTELARAWALNGTGRLPEAAALLEKLLERVNALGWSPLVADTLSRAGGTQLKLGDSARARELLQAAFRHAALSGLDALSVTIVGQLMSALEAEGELDEAIRWHWHGTVIAERAGMADDDPRVIALLRRLAIVTSKQGLEAEARVHLQTVIDRYSATIGPEHLRVANARISLANLLKVSGGRERALAEFRIAAKIMEANLGPEHPDLAVAHGSLGNALRSLSRYEEALEEERLALRILEHSVGPGHPNIPILYNNVGNTLKALDRPVEARDAYLTSIRLCEEHRGAEDVCAALGEANLGSMLSDDEKFDEALVHLRRAQSLLEAVYPASNSQVGLARFSVGDTLRKSGDLEGALEILTTTAAGLAVTRSGEDLLLLRVTASQGDTLVDLERHEEAIALLDPALDDAASAKGSRGENRLIQIAYALGRARWATGDESGARRTVQDALDRGVGEEKRRSMLQRWLAERAGP